MRIMTNNIIANNSSILMTQPNTSYPVSNIYNNMLEDTAQAASGTTTITIIFDTDQIVDTILFGYHNAATVIFVFKDSSDQVIHTETFSYPQLYTKKYINKLTTVRKIEITLTTSEAYIFIGNIFCSNYVQMHNVRLPIDVEYTDTSVYEQTLGGQMLYREGITLQSFTVNCDKLTDAQIAEFKAAYDVVHQGKCWWMDRYEDLVDEPIYGAFSTNYHTIRINTLTNLSFAFKEAR